MSTTVTAVALGDDGYVVANVGDSRTYLLRDGALTQLTRDDSWVQLMVDSGELTPEAARDHPQRSLVLAALDGEPERAPALTTFEARAGRPAAAVLRRAVRRGRRRRDRGDAAQRRARATARSASSTLALAAGGRDNVSAVVADVTPRRDPSTSW